MQPFEWSERYEIQISQIDSQHQNLFAIVNELYFAIRQHKQREELLVIGKKLEEYTDYHFSVEEKNFEQLNYAKKDEHIKQHHVFQTKVNEFVSALQTTAEVNTLEMLDFLTDWLINHILLKDKKYAPLFQANINDLILS